MNLDSILNGSERADINEIHGGLSKTVNGATKATYANLAMIFELDWRFDGLALDSFAQKIVWRQAPPWGGFACDWRDEHATKIAILIAEEYQADFSTSKIFEVASSVALDRAFNPLQDALKSLAWDGVARVDKWLSYYCGVEPSAYVQDAGRVWLLQTVKRALTPGCKADLMLVLAGPQGAGKSTIGKVLGGEYFADDLPSLEGKDASQYLAGAWIIELAELNALEKTENNAVKKYLSQRQDRYRPSYGRTTVTVPRSCSFLGTTNADQFLRDATGSRRFLPVTVGTIDLAALRADRDQLLAEAVHRIKEGEQWWLDNEAATRAAEQSQGYQESDAWETKIGAYLSDHPGDTTTHEIINSCLLLPPAQQHVGVTRRIGSILKSMHYSAKTARVSGQEKPIRVWRKDV